MYDKDKCEYCNYMNHSEYIFLNLAEQLPVSTSESVTGFQMRIEDFPPLPCTTGKGSNGKCEYNGN